MDKINIGDLHLIVNTCCNYRCKYCFRGSYIPMHITQDVVDSVFRYTGDIETVTLTGGEPFIYPKLVEMIMNSIIYNKVNVRVLGAVTNGTFYTERIKQIFYKYLQEAREFNSEALIAFNLSNDFEHFKQFISLPFSKRRIARKNIKRLEVDPSRRKDIIVGKSNIYDEGRARDLKISGKIKPYIQNADILLKDSNYYIDSLCIFPNGMITEAGVSFERMASEFDYGNVTSDSGLVKVLKDKRQRGHQCTIQT